MASLIFNWKLVEAESRNLKQSSEQRERRFSEPHRCLKMWECLPEERCSRMRVAKGLSILQALQPAHENRDRILGPKPTLDFKWGEHQLNVQVTAKCAD